MTEGQEPRLISVATAVPPYRIEQTDAKDFTRALFGKSYRDIERLLPVFDNAGVESRHFCVPLSWFGEEHTFPERNELYAHSALSLSAEAARRALDRAGKLPGDVGAVIFVSTTGLAAPSLDSRLIFELDLSNHVRRIPLWGLGCAGGAAGIARAAEQARAYPGQLVLLVTVELCGLTFQRNDLSKANLVSTSLFSDGAAAALVGMVDEPHGLRLLASHSTTWPGTEDVMGWNFVETGFKVRISKSIPEIVRRRAADDLNRACSAAKLSPDDLRHYVIHPGGARVAEAFEEVLGLEPGGLAFSRKVLCEYGNMSSVTVLFVLEHFLRAGEHAPGDYGVISALGPGFSAEHVLFRC